MRTPNFLRSAKFSNSWAAQLTVRAPAVRATCSWNTGTYQAQTVMNSGPMIQLRTTSWVRTASTT